MAIAIFLFFLGALVGAFVGGLCAAFGFAERNQPRPKGELKPKNEDK